MSKQEGLQGEALIAEYLRNNGFQLVAHSYYCRFGMGGEYPLLH